MTITSVLAVVVVTDAQAAHPWYERVLGKRADLNVITFAEALVGH